MAEQKPHNVAFITGASSGIGKATALYLASNNYDLFLVAREQAALAKVEQEFAKYSIKVHIFACDVTKPAMVNAAVASCIKAFGKIDVLINNAGIGYYGNVVDVKVDEINQQMLTNYFGTVLCTKAILPHMLNAKHGQIINVASIAGLVGVPGLAPYCASKFAVVGFSETLQYELAETNVTVSVICPGKVRTNFFNASFKNVEWATDGSGLSASDVAKTIHQAIREKKFMYIVPKKNAFYFMMKSLVPNRFVKKCMADMVE